MSSSLLNLSTPLPRHDLHMIEASAGTGKTYTLSQLVVRYVVEQNVAMDQILLVTFTNEAAAELKHRVRGRLRSLLVCLQTGATDGDYLATEFVARMDTDTVIDRLSTAVNDFDQATITTIHAFSQQIVKRSGLDDNPVAALRSDLSTLESDLIADHLATLALRSSDDEEEGEEGKIPKDDAVLQGVRMARNHPGALVRPGDEVDQRIVELQAFVDLANAHDGPFKDVKSTLKAIWDEHGGGNKTVGNNFETAIRQALDAIEQLREKRSTADAVKAVQAALANALREAGELGFADLLTRAAELVADSADLQAELRRRYRVVFVDEFQDTDPVQWSLLLDILGGIEDEGTDQTELDPEPPVMMVVGDPKQAIYRFRGGDILTYVRARDRAANLHSLDVNHRSTPEVIDGLNHLFAGSTFGQGIEYGAVGAAKASAPLSSSPIGFRLVDPALSTDAARVAIASDLADQVVRANAVDGISFSNMAVLYASHRQAPDLLRALTLRGVPAAITRGESVLESPAVGYWRRLFFALERTSDAGRARAAMLTPLLGFSPDELLDAQKVRGAQLTLRQLAAQLETRGVAAVSRIILRDLGGTVSLATQPEGDRELIDIEHLAELLHLGTKGQPSSPTAVRELLDELVFADPDDLDYAAELTKRRLDTETDADVVRLMSVHASKGLEFDLVLCPTLWTAPANTSPWQYEENGKQVLHYSSSKFDTAQFNQFKAERLDELTRLAYVALTRAAKQLVIWWQYQKDGSEEKADRHGQTGFASLLQQRAATLPGAPPNAPAVMGALANEWPELFTVAAVEIDDGEETAATEPGSSPAPLEHQKFSGTLDRSGARLSFSQLTAIAFPYEDRPRHAPVDPEANDDQGSQDENPDEVLMPPTPRFDDEVPLGALPFGKDAGDRMHQIFENVDFAQDDAARREAIRSEVERFFGDLNDTERTNRIIDGFEQAMQCSLGSDLGSRRLVDLEASERLAEMEFELPLLDGESSATLPSLADVLLEHLPNETAKDQRIRAWAESLKNPKETRSIGGFLTGSIDLLYRFKTEAGDDQYVVADYKSNKIVPWGQPMLPDSFGADAMLDEMEHGQYLLQALLYMVATHRFLGLRLVDYDPDRHLGPAAYLFVRGMTGDLDEHGEPFGVFTWRPPTTLILAVDALLFRSEA